MLDDWSGFRSKMVSVGPAAGGGGWLVDSCGEQQWAPVQVNASNLSLTLHEGQAGFVYDVDAGGVSAIPELESSVEVFWLREDEEGNFEKKFLPAGFKAGHSEVVVVGDPCRHYLSADAMVEIEDAEWCAEEVEGCFNPDWEQDVLKYEWEYGSGADFDHADWSSFVEHWEEEHGVHLFSDEEGNFGCVAYMSRMCTDVSRMQRLGPTGTSDTSLYRRSGLYVRQASFFPAPVTGWSSSDERTPAEAE